MTGNATPERIQSTIAHYMDLIEHRELFCYTVTTPIDLTEFLSISGFDADALSPSDGHDTLAEEGCTLIGQVGCAVITFDESGTGRYSISTRPLAAGLSRGVVYWNSYNLLFSYTSHDGHSIGWDEEQREPGDDESADRMIRGIREGHFARYAELFQRYIDAEREDDEEGADPTYLQAVMLTILELETGVRVDDAVLDGLPHALHIR